MSNTEKQLNVVAEATPNSLDSSISCNADGIKIPSGLRLLDYLTSYCVNPLHKVYNTRAVKILIKKLKGNKKEINKLISAVTSYGSYPTKCVTVMRKKRSTIQITTQKDFPHVIYCRIWRWGESDLHKSDIIHIPSCSFGFELKRKKICVNPYHYEKITQKEESEEVPQQPPLQMTTSDDLQQSQHMNQLSGEKLINVEEHEIDNTDQSQQPVASSNGNAQTIVPPQNQECFILADTSNTNNNVESTILPSSTNHQLGYSNNLTCNLHEPVIESNLHQHSHLQLLQQHSHIEHTSAQLQRGMQQNENNLIYDNRNVETPLLPTSLPLNLEQSYFERLSLSNDQDSDNCRPSRRISLQNSPLIFPDCSQHLIETPPNTPLPNNLPMINIPLSSNTPLPSNSPTNNLPLPSSTPLPNNPLINNIPLCSSSPLPSNPPMNNQPLPSSTPLPNNPPINNIPQPSITPLPSTPLPNNPPINNIPLPSSTPIPSNSPTNNQPLPSSTPLPNNPPINNIPQSSITPPSNPPTNNLPLPRTTPPPNNPPMFSHNVIGGFQPAAKQHNEQPTNCSNEWRNKEESSDFTIEQMLATDNIQQIASYNEIDNSLNESLDRILSQVQNNNQPLSNTNQKNEEILNNTEQVMTGSNTEQVLNSSEELADSNIPIVVRNYNETVEQNINQQLRPTDNGQLEQHIDSVSPVSAIASLSPATTIHSLSPATTIHSLSPATTIHSLSPERCDEYTLLQFDSNNEKNSKKNNKLSTSKEQLQRDKTLHLEETVAQSDNSDHINIQTLHNDTQTTSQLFKNSMISFINNNNAKKLQISSTSKFEHYLHKQSAVKSSPAYSQPSTNNDNDLHTSNETNNLNHDHTYIMKIQSHDVQMQRNGTNVQTNKDCNNSLSEHWCSIAYFEFDDRVGETFKVKNEHVKVVIDGYLDPVGRNRFSLGRLTNVARTEECERTRLHIAQGIALELSETGDVLLRCKSKNSVFVESQFLDTQSQYHSRDCVHKIFPGNEMKVFDFGWYYKQIQQLMAKMQTAHKAQMIANGEKYSTDFPVNKCLKAIGMTIDDLRRLSILRISFVKGWGSNYPRQTIKETPCWVEVQLYKPLEILDGFLNLNKPKVQ